MTAPQYVLVLTTLPAESDAPAFAETLVRERLAACVNVNPEMISVFRWEGAIQQERERQILIKTTTERVAALWGRLRELHPYDVPEFLVVPVTDGNEAYLRWIRESTDQPEQAPVSPRDQTGER